MKKVDFIKKLSDLTGVEAKKIVEAITAEAEEIEGLELPTLHVFTDDDLATRLINHVKISTPTIIEQAIKDARNNLKEKHGLTFEGKTLENLVATSIEAGRKEANVKPNEKITELEGVIKTLQANLGKVEGEWKGKYTELDGKHKATQRSMYVKSILPTDLDTTLPHDKLVALMGMDIQVDEEDGKRVFKDASGNVLRDAKTQNPLPAETVVSQWLEQNNIKRKAVPGRGGDNDHGNAGANIAGIKSTEDFYSYCEKNNIPKIDYGKTLVEVQKVIPDFRLQ
jgi:hypothetical protein